MSTPARSTLLGLALALAAALAPAAASAQTADRVVVGGTGSATLSPAVKVGNILFVSGQLPARGDSTIQAQTTSAMNGIKTLVEAAGSSMANVAKCTVFLTDVADFQGMNQSYQAFFPSAPPARSTVVVAALVRADAKIEVECIAAVPPQ